MAITPGAQPTPITIFDVEDMLLDDSGNLIDFEDGSASSWIGFKYVSTAVSTGADQIIEVIGYKDADLDGSPDGGVWTATSSVDNVILELTEEQLQDQLRAIYKYMTGQYLWGLRAAQQDLVDNADAVAAEAHISAIAPVGIQTVTT